VIESFGRDRINKRQLLLAPVPDLDSWPVDLPEVEGEFVAFVAVDASGLPDPILESFARKLLSQHAAYVCIWGPDCERVHDVVDAVRDRDHPGGEDDAVVMTTWHADDTLDQALWFALYTACPHDQLIETCGATVCIVVGRKDWAGDIRAALSDPDALTARVAD
jgi:hypothetical protein